MTAELIDTTTGEVVELLDEAAARRLTERIRTALDRVSTAWADLAERITEAYQRRADLALGYRSWAEYAAAELRPSEGIAADVRRQLVGMLSAQGMSTRAIAPTVGVSGQRVRQIVAEQVASDLPPEPELLDDYRRRTLADAETNSRVVKLTGPASVSDPAPARTVTGLDGKTYTTDRKETAPPRKPLRDGFRDAALDLDKIVHRFQRLASDDRLARNKNEVARYANDLTRAIDALQRVVDQMS